MSVVSNLFPPIVKDAEPAFLRTGTCNIYFSLSSFNSIEDIKHAQVTLVNQKTNQTALKTDLYPLGIKFISTISTVTNPTDDYKYYITINYTDVKDNTFELNQFYKVQIRFGDIVAENPNAAWLNNNLDHFSEWSQVCLIKGIEQPHININEFNNNSLTTLTSFPVAISGKMYYTQNQDIEKEALKSYNISIYKLNAFNYSNVSRQHQNITAFRKWGHAGYSYTFPIDANVKKIRIIGNQNSSIIAFLNSYDYVDGAAVNFSTGYNGRIDIGPNTLYEYSITNTMNYLYALLADNAGTDKTPIVYLEYYNGIIDKLIIQSDENYTNQFNPNEFYYKFIYDPFQKQVNYKLDFTYITTNLYKNTESYLFNISQQVENELHAIINVTPEEERGRMKINIILKDMPNYNTDKNLIIKRSSSKTNFTQWENLKTIQHNSRNIYQHLWYDTTIESGIWYKYKVQQETLENALISNETQPFICVFEDIFLVNKNTQLKMQFNPTISDFKYNVNESQQITLGSQYPYVKRNGNNYYKSFNIGGLISMLADQQGWYNPNYNDKHGYFYYKNVDQPFTTAKQLYGEAAVSLYNTYNEENNITYNQDYIYEKQFRQKVMDFLYQNNVKLFKSLTQGNILIKLTNISLSPIEALGRMLYSFSASAVQIDDNNIENLNKYNLINKFYYTYGNLSITDNFENEQSLINKFYQQLSISDDNKNISIIQLDFNYSGQETIVIYAKPINNKILFRYVLKDHNLTLTYSDADPIAECYFYGIHLNNSNYTQTNEYYNTIEEITNPINNGIYYISDKYVYAINDYISYYSDGGILETYSSEIISNPPSHTLLVQPLYYQMIYYNNAWYPFSSNQDVMINDFNATVNYLYRIKKED